MTLREDILRLSNVTLQEEVLEEGLGKVVKLGAIVGLLAAAVAGGIKHGKPVYDNYKAASSMTVPEKVKRAASSASKYSWNGITFSIGPYNRTSYTLDIECEITDYVRSSIEGEYGRGWLGKKQIDRTELADRIIADMKDAIDRYEAQIKLDSSELEKIFSRDTYVKGTQPIKIRLNFKADENELKDIQASPDNKKGENAQNEFRFLAEVVLGTRIRNYVADRFGIDRNLVQSFINGHADEVM